MLFADGLDVLAADLLVVEIPEQPVVVGDELVELAVPLLGQATVELLDERQERPLGWETLFVRVQRDVCVPAEAFAVAGEAEAVEEILAADQRDIPQARDAARV